MVNQMIRYTKKNHKDQSDGLCENAGFTYNLWLAKDVPLWKTKTFL